MHMIDARGRIFSGFDAYRSLALSVPLGWVVLPLLYVPGAAAIGRRAYRAIAARRTTTTCLLPSAAEPVASQHTT
jgi:predicted DCC family thiol-disulfide oxidoreductase YuxK